MPCIIRSVLLILLNSRTSKLQLQPDLTTIRESQPLGNPQMTTNRESQFPISALDSETRITATDFLVFALSLCGNLSTLPLIAKVRKSPYFKPFSRYLPHFLDSRTTVSICASLSKLKLISSAMIGSLNLIDLSHWPLGCRSS